MIGLLTNKRILSKIFSTEIVELGCLGAPWEGNGGHRKGGTIGIIGLMLQGGVSLHRLTSPGGTPVVPRLV